MPGQDIRSELFDAKYPRLGSMGCPNQPFDMTWVQDLTDEADEVLNTPWTERRGYVVPESENVLLKSGAVNVEAAFLYADLAGSSILAKLCPPATTAKIIRVYLACCARLIRAYRGDIRSFDGDRVMGVFMSDAKESDATNCAREIDWVVENIIGPRAQQKFQSVKKNQISITHAVGIDVGPALCVRAGIREYNDLIWIGQAPSFAARLSELRKYPYTVFITQPCHSALGPSEKYYAGTSIWESDSINFTGKLHAIYRTAHPLQP